MNPKKSMFAVLEGNLLGKIISRKRISIDIEMVEAISQIPMPRNKKDM